MTLKWHVKSEFKKKIKNEINAYKANAALTCRTTSDRSILAKLLNIPFEAR